MMQVGLGFGALVERFLVDLGAKLGGRKKGSQDDVKKMIENCFQKSHAGHASHAVAGGVGPYNQPIQTPRGTPLGIRHSSRALKARWRINLCSYFFLHHLW